MGSSPQKIFVLLQSKLPKWERTRRLVMWPKQPETWGLGTYILLYKFVLAILLHCISSPKFLLIYTIGIKSILIYLLIWVLFFNLMYWLNFMKRYPNIQASFYYWDNLFFCSWDSNFLINNHSTLNFALCKPL